MITPFIYSALPLRVVFGNGTLNHLVDEAELLGLSRILVLSTPQQNASAEAVAQMLGPSSVGVYSGATMHTPVDVTHAAMAEVMRLEVDGLVAVGGGSTTGLSKAIAYRTGLPQIVVPTTYAGSEVTPILGQTEDGRKTTLRDKKVLPETVIYDVDLTIGLPVGLSGTSGINAIAHAVEALYAQDKNPVISLMAKDGIAAMARALPAIAVDPNDRAARTDALYGAWLCGVCLGSVSTALHHKLCHTLGGSFDLPHAETHTIILPHALRYNEKAAPEAARIVAESLGVSDPAQGLFDLAGAVSAPRSLSSLGMPESGIDQATDIAMNSSYWNPRDLDRDGIHKLLSAAWSGSTP